MPQGRLTQETAWVATGWVRWWVWASILAGWVLTTAVLAALTGLLNGTDFARRLRCSVALWTPAEPDEL